MKTLALSGWPVAVAGSVLIAAWLACVQASGQTGHNTSTAPPPARLSVADRLSGAAVQIVPREPLRLRQWAELISADASQIDVAEAIDFDLFATAPESSTELDELRGDLSEHPIASRRQAPQGRIKRFADRLMDDQLNFYSRESLLMLGGGLAMAGIMANTSLDRNMQRHLQSSLHHANTDEWLESLHANKEFGDGTLTLPIFAGAWIAGSLLPESRGGEVVRTWGENSLRGFLVGAPPLLVLQLATGGSRPGEALHGSEWQPFHDDNGVSGHSFMGALPFITAAKMTDSPGWKTAFYAASTLAPLSRTADGAHYPSQIALGWWMAFLSASAVHATDHPGARWRVFPTAVAGGSGMALEYRF